MTLLSSAFALGSRSSMDWIDKWRQLNNFTGGANLTGAFDPNIFQYTPEEYRKAGIGLLPVAGRTVKWQGSQWQSALDKARINLQLERDKTAQTAQETSIKAQNDIMTEAEKAAEAVKRNARKATGRRGTILTTPTGVSSLLGQ